MRIANSTLGTKRRLLVLAGRTRFRAPWIAGWDHLLVDEDDPEKRIADLERQVAAPGTAREAREERKRERRESLERVRAAAGVSRAQMGRTRLVLRRPLLMLAVLGVAVFIAGLVFRHTTSWIWIGGLALFFAGFVPIIAWVVADDRKIEKVRWQEGTVMFRKVAIEDHDGAKFVYCEVELNPNARITRVHTTVAPTPPGVMKRLVVGATMRCLIERPDMFALRVFPYAELRVFPYAEPDAPLPSGRELRLREREKTKAQA